MVEIHRRSKVVADSSFGEAFSVVGERFSSSNVACNADMYPAEVRKFCSLDEASNNLIHSAMRQLNLSAHAYQRILKLARIIADLA